MSTAVMRQPLAEASPRLYCILLGYLIFRSTFLPRIIGVPV